MVVESMMRQMLAIVWLAACFGCYTADLSADGGLLACTDECSVGRCSNGYCLPDSQPTTDASTRIDMGLSLPDASVSSDAGSQSDSGQPADTGVQPDSGADPRPFVEGWRRPDLLPNNSPGIRSEAKMAHFPPTQVTILFGGLDSSGTTNCYDSTHGWDGNSWSRVQTTSAPSQRYNHQLVYDEARRVLVLFGGHCNNTYPSDTWIFNGQSWSQANPDTAPPGRAQFAMGYDPISRRVILFGGANCPDGGCKRHDTWAWDGSNWAEISDDGIGASHANQNQTMAYDPLRQRLIMWGGYPAASITQTSWSGSSWETIDGASQINTSDARGAQMVTYGQQGVALFGWLWSNQLMLGTAEGWSELAATERPSERTLMSMAYDSSRGQIVMYGGIARNNDRLEDTWVWQIPAAEFPPGPTTLPSGDQIRCRKFENGICSGAQWYPGRNNQSGTPQLGCRMGAAWHDVTIQGGSANDTCAMFCRLADAMPVTRCDLANEIADAEYPRGTVSMYLAAGDNEGTRCELPPGHQVRVNGSGSPLTQIAVGCTWPGQP